MDGNFVTLHSMNAKEQETDLRAQARNYRLGLQLESGLLRVVFIPVDGEASLQQFSIPLDPTVPASRSLEDAIYATPVLLADYASIHATVVTDSFIPVPTGLVEDGVRLCGLEDEASGEALLTDQPLDSMEIAWTFDRTLYNFLKRTFRNCPVQCSLTPLVQFFSAKALRGNTGKLFVHFHGTAPRRMDLMAFSADGRPLLVTTKRYTVEADALYYILAAMETTGLSRTEDEIQMCGDSAARDALMPLLRRYVRFAVPVIFPSEAFKMGREALQAPFPLIVNCI